MDYATFYGNQKKTLTTGWSWHISPKQSDPFPLMMCPWVSLSLFTLGGITAETEGWGSFWKTSLQNIFRLAKKNGMVIELVASQATPPQCTPPRNKAVLRAY